jgi:Toastrack DUF4097
MNKFLTIAAGCTLMSASLSLAVHAEVTEEITQSFAVSSGSKLSLNNLNGSVSLVSGNDGEIRVFAIKKAVSNEDLERITVKMSENGNEVVIDTKYDKNSGNYSNSGSVKYTVTLPDDVSLSKVELVNGSLKLDNIKGDISVDLVNGSVKGSGLTGNTEVSSVNGSIKLDYQTLENSVDKINLETVNGSIKLYLPENSGADVEAETMHGSLTSDFGFKVDKQVFSGKEMTGSIGNGHTKIDLQSVNGSIKVMKN